MVYDRIKEFFEENEVNIGGGNLGGVYNASFGLMSEKMADNIKTDKQMHAVKNFEKFFERILEAAEEQEVSPMQVEDGKVVLYPGQIDHTCHSYPSMLKGIASCGVFASEWFGERESENEGNMCAFAAKSLPMTGDEKTDAKRVVKPVGKTICRLYFDEKNPIIQKLVSYDFFEYQRLKNMYEAGSITKEEFDSKFPDVVREFYEDYVEPNSQTSKTFHEDEKSDTYSWIAVPGGLPAQLINGISINNTNKKIMENLDKLHEMFPNATIFDQDYNVLRLPIPKNEQKARKKPNDEPDGEPEF